MSRRLDATPTGSRGRSIAFRVLAGLGAFALLGFGVLFLVLTFVDDEQDIHALHNVAGFAYTVPLMAIPLILAGKDPLGTVASFRVVLAASVATGVAGVIGGTMESAVFTLVDRDGAPRVASAPAARCCASAPSTCRCSRCRSSPRSRP